MTHVTGVPLIDVTRARDGQIRICRHMRHYMPGSSMNLVSSGRQYHGRRMSKPREWPFDLRDYFRRRP
jgi:hypothetical protein